MSAPTVAVVGSFMMDHIAYVERRPEPGETVRGTSFVLSEGGKGYNQAVAAARAGAAVRMIGRVGDDDLGARFRNQLANEHIEVAGVSIDEHSGTGVGLPVVDRAGENAIVIIPGANDQVTEAMIDAAADLITSSDVLLLQLEIPQAVAVHAARLAKAAGVMVMLNPAPADAIDAFKGLVDIVVPNRSELEALAPAASIEESAAALSASLGGSRVIVTLGAHGALVVDGDQSLRIPTVPVEAVDTTGAGDSFCGNVAARIGMGDTLFEAARYAVAAAGLSVMRRGAAGSNPTAEEVAEAIATQLKTRVHDGDDGLGTLEAGS